MPMLNALYTCAWWAEYCRRIIVMLALSTVWLKSKTWWFHCEWKLLNI